MGRDLASGERPPGGLDREWTLSGSPASSHRHTPTARGDTGEILLFSVIHATTPDGPDAGALPSAGDAMVHSTILKAFALLALLGVAGCGDGSSGPSCTPIFYEPTIVRFPIFAPGATLPFANARLRQEYVEYDRPGCPAPQSTTVLRFEPLVPFPVRFGYRLDYESAATGWFFVSEVVLNGLVAPTNDVLVSRDPDPIEFGSISLAFTYFQPF
jgi:hypothetical protein